MGQVPLIRGSGRGAVLGAEDEGLGQVGFGGLGCGFNLGQTIEGSRPGPNAARRSRKKFIAVISAPSA